MQPINNKIVSALLMAQVTQEEKGQEEYNGPFNEIKCNPITELININTH